MAWILVIVAMFVDVVRTGRRLNAVGPLLGFSAGLLVIGVGMGAILSVLHA